MSHMDKKEADSLLLAGIAKYGVPYLLVREDSPPPPPENTAEYLDFLEKHVDEMMLGHPDMPKISRAGSGFAVKRGGSQSRQVVYRSIRIALKKLLSEL